MTKYIEVNGVYYKIVIPFDIWNTVSHRKITCHISYWKRDTTRPLKYGSVKQVPSIPDVDVEVCETCGKSYKTRKGYLNHIHTHHPTVQPASDTNERVTDTTTPPAPVVTSTTIGTQNNNNQHIHINLPPLRNFREENQKWLTQDVIMEAIQDIPTAIPFLIQKKHFNDRFPENQNVRLENKRSIRKRLKVYEDGLWRLKDRPDLEYSIIGQVYDVLQVFIDMATEDTDEEDADDEGATPVEKRIARITRRIRASEMRSARVRQVMADWEHFSETIQSDYQKTVEPFQDRIDTFLLDNELLLEQLRERRAMLMA